MSRAIKGVCSWFAPGTDAWIQNEQLREILPRHATRQEDNHYNTWKIKVPQIRRKRWNVLLLACEDVVCSAPWGMFWCYLVWFNARNEILCHRTLLSFFPLPLAPPWAPLTSLQFTTHTILCTWQLNMDFSFLCLFWNFQLCPTKTLTFCPLRCDVQDHCTGWHCAAGGRLLEYRTSQLQDHSCLHRPYGGSLWHWSWKGPNR